MSMYGLGFNSCFLVSGLKQCFESFFLKTLWVNMEAALAIDLIRRLQLHVDLQQLLTDRPSDSSDPGSMSHVLAQSPRRLPEEAALAACLFLTLKVYEIRRSCANSRSTCWRIGALIFDACL